MCWPNAFQNSLLACTIYTPSQSLMPAMPASLSSPNLPARPMDLDLKHQLRSHERSC